MFMTERAKDGFVLMYHHVSNDPRLRVLAPFVVTPQAFELQLAALTSRNLIPQRLSEIGIDNSNSERRNAIGSVTFDDCPKSLFDSALPSLEGRQKTATFFAVAGKTGGTNDWEALGTARGIELMNWADLRELLSAGHEVGGHG